MMEKKNFLNESVEQTLKRLTRDMSKHRRMGNLTPLVSVDYPIHNLRVLEQNGTIKMSPVEPETCDYPFQVYGVDIV